MKFAFFLLKMHKCDVLFKPFLVITLFILLFKYNLVSFGYNHYLLLPLYNFMVSE